MPPNPVDHAKVLGELASTFKVNLRSSNIPHEWHLKSTMDAVNITYEVSWHCFLWYTLRSFLDIIIHIMMNYSNIEP